MTRPPERPPLPCDCNHAPCRHDAERLLVERDALAEKFAAAVDDFTAEALEHTAALQRAAKAERERDALAAEVERLRDEAPSDGWAPGFREGKAAGREALEELAHLAAVAVDRGYSVEALRGLIEAELRALAAAKPEDKP